MVGAPWLKAVEVKTVGMESIRVMTITAEVIMVDMG